MEQNTEQNAVQETTDNIPTSETKKKNTGLIAGMVICAVFAIGGVAFGIYGMTQNSSKDNQISDLKFQIEDFNNKIASLETKEYKTVKEDTETTNEDIPVATVVDSTEENINPENYIYVGEWGKKIKISDGLYNISYEFLGDGYHRSCRTLSLSASTKGDGSKPAFVKTGGDEGDYLGSVMRCPKEDFYPYGTAININDSNYTYYYNSIQYSITQTDWETESVNAIKNMLTNPDNYSAI